MGRTILCPHCKSTFDETVLAKKADPNICPVCEKSLLSQEDSSSETVKQKSKWYYYKEGGGGLDDTLYTHITPLYTFEAVDMEDAERQLKEVMPNSPLVKDNTSEKVKCPYCRSEQVQIVPKKFSLLVGFATNSYQRVCLRCKRKF